ncbi:MAG TPA: tetratricopeptide repeat protein [Pseudonocardiaceae bacterium]|nr:tetratricopeptide repeat protein [Pseudonocardiaceae bacterium]
MSYRLARDSDDPDAAALASLRLAGLAELRDQPAEAVRRYADVAALRHPVTSPPAVLWLARRAFQNGDRPAARALAHEVVDSGDGRLIPDAWGLLAILAWHDEDREGAVAAMRLAVDTAGQWHWSFSRSLGEMLAACGDPAGAADAYRELLNQPLLTGADADRYVQLMAIAGRVDEAAAVLERHAADGEPLTGDLLLALASAHAARDDLEATRETLAVFAPTGARCCRRYRCGPT